MIEPTDEMRQAFDAAIPPGRRVELRHDELDACLAAVLAIVERSLRIAIAEDIKQALAVDEADSDVTSGEAIWEQSGYRRGLADAAEIANPTP